ncbi:MAG: MMPL family transporter [Myxococcales bacterium]|nr:MMPL family transporter [Myxococcales bacterium]MCB9523741.1 MMPL family transporter [Myxococcales bacterium]
MVRFVQLVMARPRTVLAVWLLLTLAAGAVLTQAVISSSMGRLFFGDSPAYAEYIERSRTFGYDEVIVVGLEGVAPLAPQTLDRLEQATAALTAGGQFDAPAADDGFGDDGVGGAPAPAQPPAPGAPELSWIRRVHSVLSAERVRREGQALKVEPYAEAARRDPAQAAALTRALAEDPLYGGRMTGRDGQHTVVVVELKPNPDRAEERTPALVAAVVKAFTDAGFDRDRIHLAGHPVVMSTMIAQTQRNLQAVLPVTALVLLLTVFVLFRRLWPAAIAGAVAFTGVIWTMAVAVLIDPRISIMHSVAPGVILIVASSDVIHLCSAYLNELGHGRTKTQAILASAADVGTACVYTSLTTLLGFVALSFVPTPVFRQLGIILGVGVAFALLIAVTVAPALFALMREPKPWREGSTSAVQRGLDRALAACARAATRRPMAMTLGWLALLAVSLVGLSRLDIETRLADRLAEGDPVRVDQRWFAQAFAPNAQLDLFVDSGTPRGVLDAGFVHRLADFEARLAARTDVDSVFSITDVWSRIHAVLGEDGQRLPRAATAFAEYTLLFELGGADTLSRLLDFERRQAVLQVRLPDEGVRAAWRTANAAVALAHEVLGPAVKVQPSGIQYLVGEWIGEILDGQKQGLLFSFLVIALMMTRALGSWKAGLWSMLPNLLPLFMLAGLLGFTQDATDSDTLMLAMLAIGIGVDDTIHFLVRFRLERQRGVDRETALARTFDFAGRAIVMTTVVLTLGFLPFALTDYYSTWVLGTLLPLTLVFALAADVLLVPAMALLGPLDPGGPKG